MTQPEINDAVRRLGPGVLEAVAKCLEEISEQRQNLGEFFDDYPLGQRLIGYIRGVSVGSGIDILSLIKEAEKLLPEPLKVEEQRVMTGRN